MLVAAPELVHCKLAFAALEERRNHSYEAEEAQEEPSSEQEHVP
jgi:hypothetical protein